MRDLTVSDLKCPHIKNGSKCYGNLNAEVLSRNANEIIDGFLICSACKTKYPIIQGIPILLNDLKKYFTENFAVICDIVGGAEVMHRDLFLFGLALTFGNFDKMIPFNEPYDLRKSHFRYQVIEYTDEAMRSKFISKQFKTKQQVIREWLSKKYFKKEKAIDLGCSVGGFTNLLAQNCSFAYGVDHWYPFLFHANKIALGLASNKRGELWGRLSKWEKIGIKIKKVNSMDFILASLENLPFKSGTFGAVFASHIIDLVPEAIREGDRLLKKGGEFFLAVANGALTRMNNKEVRMNSEIIKQTANHINFYKNFCIITTRDRHDLFSEKSSLPSFFSLDWMRSVGFCMIGRKIKK